MKPSPYNICKCNLIDYVNRNVNMPDGSVTKLSAIRAHRPYNNTKNTNPLERTIYTDVYGYRYANIITGVEIIIQKRYHVSADTFFDNDYKLIIRDPEFKGKTLYRYECGWSKVPSTSWNNNVRHHLILLLLTLIAPEKVADKYELKHMYPRQCGVSHKIYELLAEKSK